jgi:peptidoglycan biosynthesis protein MviN/MurJ (putative lipid II flippase)
MPLLVIGPVLIPMFTRLSRGKAWALLTQGIGEPARTADTGFGSSVRAADLQWALKAELMLACATALALQLGWTPLMEPLTSGKYGAINQSTINILSLCIPVLYLNNFLWTLHFVQGRLTLIFWAFAVSIFINIAGNLLLMPLYGNMGAAMAYVGAMFIQTLMYTQKLSGAFLKSAWITLAACLLCSMAAGYTASRWVSALGWQFLAAGIVYVLGLIFTAQLKGRDLIKARNLMIR